MEGQYCSRAPPSFNFLKKSLLSVSLQYNIEDAQSEIFTFYRSCHYLFRTVQTVCVPPFSCFSSWFFVFPAFKTTLFSFTLAIHITPTADPFTNTNSNAQCTTLLSTADGCWMLSCIRLLTNYTNSACYNSKLHSQEDNVHARRRPAETIILLIALVVAKAHLLLYE